MAQRDFLFIPNLEDQAIDVDNALVTPESPIYLTWSVDGSGNASPASAKSATIDFFVNGVSTFSLTATGTPDLDDIDVTIGAVSAGLTHSISGDGTRFPVVTVTHTKSGKQATINFIVIDYGSGGTGK